MQTFFAYADAEEAFDPEIHNRFDEQVFAWEITETEGELPSMRVDIKNPRVGFLSPGRKAWAWLAVEINDTPTPLFYGRIVGVPEQLQDEIVRLQFIARPYEYDDLKRTVAGALKTLPDYDPVFIDARRRDDPDAALEARPALWQVDRVTHELIASNIIAGEGQTYDFGPDKIIYNSLGMSFRSRPASRVDVEAQVFWDQGAAGTIDLTGRLVSAFAAAGSASGGRIITYTGEGLSRTWPQPGRNIGAGWSVGNTSLRRIDGSGVPQRVKTFRISNGNTGAFPRWTFAMTFPVDYSVQRSRTEVVRFALSADVQRIFADADDDDAISVTLSSADISEPIDADDVSPLPDARLRTYFLTDRGKQSINYLIRLARTRLLFRARAIDISCEVPFSEAYDLRCKDNARLIDARIPGGEATGKVVGYSLSLNGDGGAPRASLTIACTIGEGNALTVMPGVPSYVDDGYVHQGYQAVVGGSVAIDADGSTVVGYADIDDAIIDDDGLNLTGISAANVVDSIFVLGGAASQEAVLNNVIFEDFGEAITAVNAQKTEVALALKPLTGGPFTTEFDLVVTDAFIPKTIDLAGGAS